MSILMSSTLTRILVVDDEPDLCALTKEFLGMLGDLDVHTASSVPEARAMLAEKRYEAIVSDYQMPEEDGIQFLRSLRSAGDRIPFILFTGKGREEVVIEALNQGADAYLQKGGEPLSQYTELGHRVRMLVGRQQAEGSLLEGESKQRRAEELAGFGYWQIDLVEKTITNSHGAVIVCGLEKPTLSLADWQMIFLPECRSSFECSLKDLIENSRPYDIDAKISRPRDGRIVDVRFLAEYDRQKNKVFGVLQDITVRSEYDLRLQRLNRELAAIKECDRAMTKARTEQELLDDICRIVCEVAGYRMAWIGMAEHDERRSVLPVAQSGHAPSYVAQIEVTWGEDERGNGPTGVAIKTGRTAFIQDFECDPHICLWRELALEYGYRSVIALPLMSSGVAFGALLIYSEKINGFIPDEVKLLEEMASDLAYGIIGLRAHKEREEAREELQRQSTMLSILNDIISTANQAENLPQLLDRILVGSLRLLDFDAGGIYLVDRPTRTANVVCSKFLPPEFLAAIHTLSIDDRPYDTLFIKNEPIITDNYSKVNPTVSERFGFLSIASIPLISKGLAIGSLNFASMRQHVISEEQKQTLISISRELGSTIERMVAEEESRKAAKNLETLFNSIDEMVFVLDMQGLILEVNHAVQKQLKYLPGELTNTDVLLLHVPERRDEASQIVKEMIAGTADSCPVPVLAKDGTRLEVETKITRGWWNNQEVLIGVARDVSERKRAEEALHQSEEKHRLLVENSHDIIYTIDATGVFNFVSPSWTAVLGHPVDQVVGRHFQSYVHEGDLPRCMALIQRAFETGQRQTDVEYRVRHSDGTWRWHISNAVTLVDGNGKGVGIEGISVDITERKRAEEALQAANHKLNLLSGMTRHDIKNQLMILEGNLSLMDRGRIDSMSNEHLGKAATAAERISAMIQFTKEYEDVGVRAPIWQDIRKLVEKTTKDLPLGSVRVVNDVPPSMDMFADPLITKVFYNLIQNSLRHGGGTSTIVFSLEEQGGSHSIVCADDGAGIPADMKGKLFCKGFGKDHGLGLFLSREILGITDFSIAEIGEPGQGARFVMTGPPGGIRDRLT